MSRNDDPIPTLLQGLCPVTASISRALMTLFSVLMWGTGLGYLGGRILISLQRINTLGGLLREH